MYVENITVLSSYVWLTFYPEHFPWEDINKAFPWFHIQSLNKCQKAVTHWEGFNSNFLPNVFYEKVIISNSYVRRKHISTEFLCMYSFLPQALPYEKVLIKKFLDFTYNYEKNVRKLLPIEKLLTPIFWQTFFMRR